MSFFLSGVAGGPHRDLFGGSEIDAGEAQVEQHAVEVLITLALVIGGYHDQATPPDVVEKLAAALPRSDFVMFDRSGHLPAVEQPKVFAHTLMNFVERIIP